MTLWLHRLARVNAGSHKDTDDGAAHHQDYDTTIEFYRAPLLAKSNFDDAIVHNLDHRVIRAFREPP
ncbi:hypothetical protein GUJ93_ZPchr0075g2716 [Zizania palustris]|uniref:Uncharacterized protein n=1 Tax=Zizania palustris TaxID=103762 RepID=A0A8J5V385_ZIZPA|nr:hypothetical protein GUJ93_ZPchr0075g2716 [Zizania palustris]